MGLTTHQIRSLRATENEGPPTPPGECDTAYENGESIQLVVECGSGSTGLRGGEEGDEGEGDETWGFNPFGSLFEAYEYGVCGDRTSTEELS
jgi:hypothetical protein